jgi:SAM-dependent methyltransferase
MTSPDFYRHARAYDIAFGQRDFAAECDFLEWCLQTHSRLSIDDLRSPISPSSQIALDSTIDNQQSSIGNRKSFLELACGPARHAREFARRGWRSVGLDLSEDMLAYAAECAGRAGTPIETISADMCDFTLAQPVALAASLIESLSHLVTNEQIVAHLRAVARNLLPGGIFVIELAHPSTLWRDSLPNVWSREEDGIHVEMVFGLADDPYDWITQQWSVTSRLTIREPGRPERVVETRCNHRWPMAQELRALIDLSGAFEQSWWYGALQVPPPALHGCEECERMVVVLRK